MLFCLWCSAWEWRAFYCEAAVWAVGTSWLAAGLLPDCQGESLCGLWKSRFLHQVWFALKLIYIEGLLRTCSACLISSTEPIKQTNLLDKWQFVLNFRRSFVLFKYKCLILWCHQITADVINMHLCLILKEKYCAAWVQTAFSHRDEGPQLPWHPAAVHQLPRCLQCTRQLPETAAGWRVFCPSGLRGGSSDLWGLWSTESTLGGSGSAHCRGRTPQTTARGAAGFNQEFPEFEWRRGGDGGSAAASGQFGD